MNGRVYDYNLGRFMSVDPFVHGGSQGINPYSYIMNNPLSGIDPSGYEPETETIEVTKDTKVFQDADGNKYVSAGDGTGDFISVDSINVSGSVTSGGITTSYSATMNSNGSFNGSVTSTQGNNSVSTGFSGDINSPASTSMSVGFSSSSCDSISCNSDTYGAMDEVLHGELASSASHSDWFAAAADVTGAGGVGMAEALVNGPFITPEAEKYLKYVHYALADFNIDTFRQVANGQTGGLSGKRLDDLLVVKEQILVSFLSENYFRGNLGLKAQVIGGLNSSFDHNSLIKGTGMSIIAPRTYRSLKEGFGNESFDMGSINHRIQLGIGIVDGFREERGH